MLFLVMVTSSKWPSVRHFFQVTSRWPKRPKPLFATFVTFSNTFSFGLQLSTAKAMTKVSKKHWKNFMFAKIGFDVSKGMCSFLLMNLQNSEDIYTFLDQYNVVYRWLCILYEYLNSNVIA